MTNDGFVLTVKESSFKDKSGHILVVSTDIWPDLNWGHETQRPEIEVALIRIVMTFI
jgi:hypothetical protein